MTATTRTPFQSLVLTAVGALLAATAGVARAAPDDLQRVEVTGRHPGETARTDVRASCPGVDAALMQRMAPLQFRTREEGMSTITFRLNGNTISEVRAARGPDIYRQPLRRAVASLNCAATDRDTLYVMQVRFRNEEDPSSGNSVAMIEFEPPAAGAPATVASAARR